MCAPGSASRRRCPDWADFYKNGLPKEVIVIDDDDDDVDPSPPPPRQPGFTGTATNGPSRRTDKKRKKPACGPVYNQKISYSTTQTPYYDSQNQSLSTGRTISALNTTAVTSHRSQVSSEQRISPLESSAVGQKRKRTRAVDREEARHTKKRELDHDDNPFSLYQPPRNPVIRAKDVHVRVVPGKSDTKHQKVDDEDGHYIVVPEAELTERYQIEKLLGQGTFGKVVQAYDRKEGTKCAIKILASRPGPRSASRIELRVLSTLASNDEHNTNRCIHLRDCFDFRNHICIVTNLYGQSVFDFLNSNNCLPFPSSHIQKFAKQLFTSVAFLHDLDLIHTDLKPENILLVNDNYQNCKYTQTASSSTTTVKRSTKSRKVLLNPDIRMIDFGSATFNDGAAKYSKHSKLNYPKTETKGKPKKCIKKLPDIIPSHTSFNRQFLNLLRQIFVYDPKKRITAKQVLQHPWFKESLVDDGTKAHDVLIERE
ncbi:hypothetical protein HBI81_249560 [Parastagonospora nodorum]|nr:hypothetical protein HBI73_250380 [Parastagonospora nodorum]KAH5617422.1 hypothetical protein HBI23_257340 [Parastagonospora nodorum]KAH5707306.1 hypothetical protein HBI18_250170 [Parastagonospora nodorum]KAH6510919.1 hypothetical protein HBI81_249560 [Parastagonospora nodorum]